jgi:hypothetical protein
MGPPLGAVFEPFAPHFGRLAQSFEERTHTWGLLPKLMKTWRVLGLVCTSLLLGLTACGDGNGGGTTESAVPVERDRDSGLDSGEEPDADDVVEEEDATPPTVEEDAGGGNDGGDIDACEPKGCAELGFNCGEPTDGCGGPLKCGSETCSSTESAYDTCGGGGTKFVCGCTPATCDSLSSERGVRVCGMVADGCGGTIECGNACTGADTCGGGPAANQCGCTPNLNPCAGKECGTASDGCGNTVQCGSNAGTCSANKECSSAQTCTCKTDQSAFCAGKCGSQVTPDGCTVNCTSSACTTTCTGGEGAACTNCTCPAGPEAGTGDDGVCRAGACCMPETVASLCGTAVCGTRVNRCGQTVTCGTCAGSNVCTSAGTCDTPAAAALIGKYAVRSVGFGKASILLSRAEGLLLVDIARDPSGKLMMREQPCWSEAYSGPSPERIITTVSPEISARARPTTIELDLTGTANVPGAGPKQWVRGVQPADQNVSGWRRGRPSYCPANGGPADETHPDFAPANDTRAIGARKPWLVGGSNGGVCLCPAQEFAVPGRATPSVCQGLTGPRREACLADRENLSLPYQPGALESSDINVTDCRVVDDDMDGRPGVTANLSANVVLTGTATVRSAAVTANVFWGEIDMSPAKRHWGVSQDQVGLQSANVACLNPQGTLGNSLCGTSSGQFCSAYQSGPPSKTTRINPVDFVSLHDKVAPSGGWTCDAVFAHRTDATWFPAVTWSTRYPASSACEIPGS